MGEIPEDLKSIIDDYKDKTTDEIDLEAFVRYWTPELSKGTLVQYIRYLSKVDFELTEDNLEAFDSWARTKADHIEFSTKEEDINTRSRFTYNTYLALRKYLKSTDEDQKIQALSTEVKKPQSESRTNYFAEDQVQKLIDTASQPRDELAIILMFYSGLRSYELLNLTPEWLEFRESEILIEIPSEYAKGRRQNPNSEMAVLKPGYGEKLKQYIKDQYSFSGEYSQLYKELAEGEKEFQTLFNFKENTAKSFQDLWKERYYINKMLKEALKRAEINKDKISAHDLRRSYMHHTYNNLNDLSKTAQLARHEDPQITQEYLDLGKEELIDKYHEGI